MHVCVYMRVRVCVHACVHVRMCVRVYACVCVCVCVFSLSSLTSSLAPTSWIILGTVVLPLCGVA